jgi:hypothetical protein
VKTAVAAVVLTVALASAIVAPAAAQEHIEHARTEHRQASSSLERDIQSVAVRGADAWIGYRLSAVPTGRNWCAAPVQLEPAKEMIVLVRVHDNTVDRLRTFAPSCSIDAGEMPMVWLDGVTPDLSANWLSTVATAAAATNDRSPSLLQPALSALETTPGLVALRSLVAFAKDEAHPNVRNRAINSLAFRAETEAAATIQNVIDTDPDTAVKKTAVGALARMPKDEGVPLLIQVARTNKNAEVRKQAMFWLGESKDPRAVSFFEEILRR